MVGPIEAERNENKRRHTVALIFTTNSSSSNSSSSVTSGCSNMALVPVIHVINQPYARLQRRAYAKWKMKIHRARPECRRQIIDPTNFRSLKINGLVFARVVRTLRGPASLREWRYEVFLNTSGWPFGARDPAASVFRCCAATRIENFIPQK